MTDSSNTPPSLPSDPRDVMVARLLDGRAGPSDWRAFRATTTSDERVWDEVIDGSEASLALTSAVGNIGDRATDVHEAAFASTRRTLRLDTPRGGGGGGGGAIGKMHRLGWLVAACLALGLVSVMVRPSQPGNFNSAGINPIAGLTSDGLMSKYVETGRKEGRVLGELPQMIVLETRANPNGRGYEVLYVRPVVERTVVDDLYKMGTDDAGRPVMVPANLPARPAGGI